MYLFKEYIGKRECWVIVEGHISDDLFIPRKIIKAFPPNTNKFGAYGLKSTNVKMVELFETKEALLIKHFDKLLN